MLKENIITRMSEFSSSQTKIARFILDNPSEAPFMTANQLGEQINVSESTVIRFANLMGYSGYPELREAMKSILLDHMTTIDRMNIYNMEEEGESSCHRFMNLDLLDLRKAHATINSQDIKDFAEAAVKAPAIYLAAQRSSKALAYYLSFYLSWFLPFVEILEESTAIERLFTAPRGSLLIGISFPRYSRWTVDIMKEGADLGLKLAVISDCNHNPMAEAKPEHILSIPCRHISFIDSFTAPMSLMSCIIIAIAEALGEGAKGQLKKLEQTWSKEKTYVI